ncbi:carboxymuconolactone decarboxylase family protein [Clostridium hydrogeniformans]|uniref:carboxymuconolactone decarboxylase family protein n=1 Tax=Clostridium hydrogeniformans TaxID=349933 RepID=UPI000480160D|nr:carboxymuconolactone decarboxylase family protein [Clostridium hydrogeniformans]
MGKSPRELLNGFNKGFKEFSKEMPKEAKSFMSLINTTYEPSYLDLKTKELISVSIGLFSRCEYCIAVHVHNALSAGATREEILEAAMVAVAFGGGPSMAYGVTTVKDCLDEFEKDFHKKGNTEEEVG